MYIILFYVFFVLLRCSDILRTYRAYCLPTALTSSNCTQEKFYTYGEMSCPRFCPTRGVGHPITYSAKAQGRRKPTRGASRSSAPTNQT